MMKFKQGETVLYHVTVEDGSVASIVSIEAKLRKQTRTLPYPLEGTFVTSAILNGWKFTLPVFPAVGKYITDVKLTMSDGTIRKSSSFDLEITESVT